jgi:hypothetical protein
MSSSNIDEAQKLQFICNKQEIKDLTAQIKELNNKRELIEKENFDLKSLIDTRANKAHSQRLAQKREEEKKERFADMDKKEEERKRMVKEDMPILFDLMINYCVYMPDKFANDFGTYNTFLNFGRKYQATFNDDSSSCKCYKPRNEVKHNNMIEWIFHYALPNRQPKINKVVTSDNGILSLVPWDNATKEDLQKAICQNWLAEWQRQINMAQFY